MELGHESPGILGTWEVTIQTPLGPQVISLEFPDEHAGTAHYGDHAVPLQNVTVSGNSATCSVTVTQPRAFTLACAVEVEADRMTGTARAGFFGTFALTGRRAGAASRTA